MIYKLLIVSIFSGIWAHASAQDTGPITAVLEGLTSGVDEQDGARLRSVFREDAALFATNAAGDDLISLSAASFADLHEQKRFGGQSRRMSVESLHVTDNLIASAVVRADNDNVHYTYYLGLVRLAGEWKIQSFLQRSRPADAE